MLKTRGTLVNATFFTPLASMPPPRELPKRRRDSHRLSGVTSGGVVIFG
jgi:hypothetical protein